MKNKKQLTKTTKKGQRYKHINEVERQEIEYHLRRGRSLRAIGEMLGRDHTSISRELRRNARQKSTSDKQAGLYESKLAENKAVQRRKNANYRGKKIHLNKKLREYIENKLKNKHWSPDTISGRMKQDKLPFYASKSAIYEYIYSPRGEHLHKYLYSKHYRSKKRKNRDKTKKARIPERIGIEKRPKAINNNQEYGHFEEDTLVSGKKHHSKVSLAVLYERKAKCVMIEKITNLKPSVHIQALDNLAKQLYIQSITFDNGIENNKHTTLRRNHSIQTYFCDPYSSWQKGGVENANKLIRRYIKKGTDISHYPTHYIRYVQDILNNKPRKSLNYKTPYEVMQQHNLLKFNTNKNTPSGALRG